MCIRDSAGSLVKKLIDGLVDIGSDLLVLPGDINKGDRFFLNHAVVFSVTSLFGIVGAYMNT